jgi:hypothetical protein
VSRYNGPGNGADFAQVVSVSANAPRVIVTGQSPGAGTAFDYATVAYDAASGEQLWVSRYNGPGNAADFATALGISPDDSRVIVTGEAFGSGSASDYATVAYNAETGDEIWSAHHNGSGNSGDAAEALVMSPDGSRVVVTGQSTGSGTGPDFVTIAYDASDGSEQWTSSYNAVNGFEVAWALGMSPDGARVVVTGQSAGAGSGPDFATVTYDTSDGGELGVVRYNGPGNGNDVSQALDVSDDGSSVFISGYSLGQGTDLDFATAAYNALP